MQFRSVSFIFFKDLPLMIGPYPVSQIVLVNRCMPWLTHTQNMHNHMDTYKNMHRKTRTWIEHYGKFCVRYRLDLSPSKAHKQRSPLTLSMYYAPTRQETKGWGLCGSIPKRNRSLSHHACSPSSYQFSEPLLMKSWQLSQLWPHKTLRSHYIPK